MNTEDVLAEFRKAGALLENGHFILSSGRRSSVFLQKALVFAQPDVSERLCAALAQKLTETFGRIDAVCGPAVGGIIPGYETARALGCRAFYTEREGGEMTMRRGFSIAPGERVVIVEDIVTTGLSMRETIAALSKSEGEILGGACVVDRSNGTAEVGLPLVSLAQVDFTDYAPEDVPPEMAAREAIKPGSRGLQ